MSGCDERFLCDEMLARLGRWLRAAGYDTAIAESGEADSQLMQQACEEDRLFITRDRKMQEYREAPGRVVLVEANQLPDQIKELSWLCRIDWLCNPFSRCLECNGELVVAGEDQRQRVPPDSLRDDETLLYCPHCDKPYWNGSHVHRMSERLQQFSAGVWEAAGDNNNGEES